MADTFPSSITDFYAGDSLRINPDIVVDDTSAITTAYLTIKTKASDADGAAIIERTITTTVSADGVITPTPASGAGSVNVRFDLVNADTLLLHPVTNPAAFVGLSQVGTLQLEILLKTTTGNDYRAQRTIRAKGVRILQGQ